MTGENAQALKEWAAVEQALAAGATTLLVRKGGIWEQRGDFRVEHREFWIFPTLYHQNPHELAAGFEPYLDVANPAHPNRDTIRIQLYCRVEAAYRVGDLDALLRLDGLHPYTEPTIRARFAYRGRPHLYVVVARVYRLGSPFEIANTLDYEGCVSWVTLDAPLPTAGLTPILGNTAFSTLHAEILQRLGPAAGTPL